MRLAAVAAAFAAGGGPAAALAPPLPTCIDGFLAPQERGNDGYDYLGHEGDIVTYRLHLEGPRRVETILEHCPTGDRVAATISWSAPPTEAEWAGYLAAADIVTTAANSDEVVTFRALERRLRARGLATRRYRADYLSCACASLRQMQAAERAAD